MGACFKVMGEVMPRAAAALSRMNSVMVEYVSGMRVIKALNMGSASFKRFRDSVDGEFGVWCEISRKTAPAYAAYLVVIECGLLIMIPLGGLMFTTGAVSGSTYLLFAFVGSLYLVEIRLLQEMGSKLAEVASGAARAQELLDMPVFGGGDPFPRRCDIELRDVRFSYDAGREVVRGCRCASPKGSGSRSSAVRRGEDDAGRARQPLLRSRFRPRCSSAGRTCGLSTTTTSWPMVAVVFQKTFLTSGASSRNIRMGLDASIEDVRRADGLACIERLH